MMIDPTIYDSYPDYRAACKAENEIPVDLKLWRSWKFPPPAEDEPLDLESKGVPSKYLEALIQEIPALKAAGSEGNDYLCKVLEIVVHELRLSNGRLHEVERELSEYRGGK